MLSAVAVRRHVFFRRFGCVVDGVCLMVGRHVRLIHGCDNVFHLVEPGCFAMVPRCVLMMFRRIFVELAQYRHAMSLPK
jgi:hypothetical protein